MPIYFMFSSITVSLHVVPLDLDLKTGFNYLGTRLKERQLDYLSIFRLFGLYIKTYVLLFGKTKILSNF